jgi:hypothetical protein
MIFENSANGTTAFQVQNAAGNTLFNVDTSGAGVTLGNAGLAGTLQIGNTTGAVTQTINLGNNATASSVTNLTIGSTIGASTTTIQGGTGNIKLLPSGTTNTGVIVKPGTDSTAAFQVQNAAGTTTLLNADTTNLTVSVTNTNNSFAAKVDSTTGTNPQNVATGDFNGDGKIDAAITNHNTNTVSVYINSGSALPTTATSTLTTGTGPQDIATGDFNGDGRTDIAVTNQSSNTV